MYLLSSLKQENIHDLYATVVPIYLALMKLSYDVEIEDVEVGENMPRMTSFKATGVADENRQNIILRGYVNENLGKYIIEATLGHKVGDDVFEKTGPSRTHLRQVPLSDPQYAAKELSSLLNNCSRNTFLLMNLV